MAQEKKKQPGVSMDVGESGADQEELSRKKRLALWISVAGTMVFVAAAWLMLLPMQLKGSQAFGFKDAVRQAAASSADSDAGRKWSETMERVRARLDELSEEPAATAGAPAALPLAEPAEPQSRIDRLKAKIEEAAAKK